MIRRDAGDDWLLIRQDDHARLSGELASHLKDTHFVSISNSPSLQTAISLHDCGWPLHDDSPTLNAAGKPIDVFESSAKLATWVWSASADLAAKIDPYAGLLVSLHVLALSAMALSKAIPPAAAPDALRDKFTFIQFQHREVERQEILRRIVGLRTDLPLTFGISSSEDPAERQLERDLFLVQAMDMLSLALCCTEPPAAKTKPFGGVALHLTRQGANTLLVDPWPFDAPEIGLQTPARRLRARPFNSVAEFQQSYAARVPETLSLRVAPAARGSAAQ